MTKPHRQRYGLGSFIKKAFKAPVKIAKKVIKSPIGKAALLGGLGWAANAGMLPGGVGTNWWSKGMGLGKNLLLGKARGVGPGVVQGQRAGGLWNWIKGNPGKSALIGGGILGSTLPFLGDE